MGVGNRTVRVAVGRVVTVWLTEPEAYASSPNDTPPPTMFPWLAAQSSDPAKLSPVAVCKQPPLITSLPVRLYPFRATSPGRYQITARLDPAYHIPHMQPRLRPLHPVRVTVVVSHSPAPEKASLVTYTVVAPVLYRTTMKAPMACLAILTSLPPAGCSGVPVTGYDFTRLTGLVRFGATGWETPQLRLIGTWNGHTLTLTRTPVQVTTHRPEPSPPAACHGHATPQAGALARRITRAHARIRMLELSPCGDTVWLLIAVADKATNSYIHEHFGSRVRIAGWLQPASDSVGLAMVG